MDETIGKRIMKHRKQLGLTQDALTVFDSFCPDMACNFHLQMIE